MLAHYLTNIAGKGTVVGSLVSVIIISLDVYEIVSNSIKLNKKFNYLFKLQHTILLKVSMKMTLCSHPLGILNTAHVCRAPDLLIIKYDRSVKKMGMCFLILSIYWYIVAFLCSLNHVYKY